MTRTISAAGGCQNLNRNNEPGHLFQDSAVSASQPQSVTHWIAELRDGDEQAATALWRRFESRVKGMARVKLRSTPSRLGDDDDLAQVVFAAVFDGIRKGRFHELNNREDLWQVLAMVTARRAIDLWRKADASRETGESGMFEQTTARLRNMQQVVAAVTDEQLADSIGIAGSELLSSLEPKLRQVALLRFEGFSNEEVASHIGRSVKTVERYLQMIRTSWTSP